MIINIGVQIKDNIENQLHVHDKIKERIKNQIWFYTYGQTHIRGLSQFREQLWAQIYDHIKEQINAH